MALTIVREPEHINFSKNSIGFRVSTDKYLLTEGLATQFQIEIDSIPAVVGKTLEFTFENAEKVVMTTANTPDDTGTQFPKTYSGIVVSGAEISTYASQILVHIKSNHTLRNNFEITCGPVGIGLPGYLSFTAKEKTSFTNILFNTNFVDFSFSGIDVTGVADVYNDNFFVGADVMIENEKNSGVFIKAGTLFASPDENNHAFFDLIETLKPYLGNDFIPNGGLQAIICENNCKRFYIEYYEFYGLPPVQKKVYQSSTYLVLKGALKHIDFYRPSTDTGYTSFWDYLQEFTPFLTWQKTRRINQTQREFLYWFNNYERPLEGGDPEVVYLRCKAYYTDGTTSEGNGMGDPDSDIDDVVLFHCGYQDLESLFTIGKTVFKYEVWLQGDVSENVITEKITFYVEEADYLDKEFYFENSLGGMETMRTTGVHEFGNDFIGEEANRTLLPAQEKATTDKSIYVINTSSRGSHIGRTGGVQNKVEAEALREFFLSEDTYAVNSKGIIYAIIIPRENRPESIDDYNLHGYEFEYKEAFINHGYSAY